MTEHVSVYQETEGRLSPWLRKIRLQRVAQAIPEEAHVLDCACGAAYLAHYLGPRCRYTGVDRVVLHANVQVQSVLPIDFSQPDWKQQLETLLPARPSVITVIAFLEHIHADQRPLFLKRCAELLEPNGQIIGTTPHPSGRLVHDALATIGLCSQEGAEEHEEFLDRAELQDLAQQCGGELTSYSRFLLGLNQFFVMSF